MRDESLSSEGAQDMDTSGYQVFGDLDEAELYWGNDQLDVDVVFRPGLDTLFSPTAFDDLEIGNSESNPILLDKKEDKENSPPRTSVSKRPTRPSALLRNRPFRTRLEKVPDYPYRNLFQNVLPRLSFNINSN